MKRIAVFAAMILAGCNQPSAAPVSSPSSPATFTHYQLVPVNAVVAWRINVENGEISLCTYQAIVSRVICSDPSVTVTK